MRRENWFVIVLVALCMSLATMAAVSSSPSNGEKSDIEGFDSPDEARVTENWKGYFPAQHEGWMRTSKMRETTDGGSKAESLINEGMDVLESV